MSGPQTQFRLSIDGELLAQLKTLAAQQGCSTSALMCRQLQLLVNPPAAAEGAPPVNPTMAKLLDCAVGRASIRSTVQALGLNGADDLRRLMLAARLPWPGLTSERIAEMTDDLLVLCHTPGHALDPSQILTLLEPQALYDLLNQPSGLNGLNKLPWTLAISDAAFNAIAKSTDGRAALIMDWMRQHQLTVIASKAFSQANGLPVLELSAREITEQWCGQGLGFHCLHVVDEGSVLESTPIESIGQVKTVVVQALQPWLGLGNSTQRTADVQEKPITKVAKADIKPARQAVGQFIKQHPRGAAALARGHMAARKLEGWFINEVLPEAIRAWRMASRELTALAKKASQWRPGRSGALRAKPETELINDFSTRLNQKRP